VRVCRLTMGCATSQARDSPKGSKHNQKEVIQIHEEPQDKYIAELVGAQGHHFWSDAEEHNSCYQFWGCESESSSSTPVHDADLDSESSCKPEAWPAIKLAVPICNAFRRRLKQRHERQERHDSLTRQDSLTSLFRGRYFGKPEQVESNWQRLARKQLGEKQRQLDMVNGRLESEGVLAAELKKEAPRAVMNYAHFHSMDPGSTDITTCPYYSTDGANICNVVLSSAGLGGWATAKVGLPEMIMTIHASAADASGRAEITCTSAAGRATIVEITSNTMVAAFHADLARKLHVRADLMRLILPNSRLLEEVDHGKYILDVFDEGVLERGTQVSQL